jgi:hypothetical protein
MLLVRDIFYCKPGKVRAMVDRFKAIRKLDPKGAFGKARILTDLSGERYWTVISEIEAESLDAFMKMGQEGDELSKQMGKIMEGYHDLVEHGRREIYTVEA